MSDDVNIENTEKQMTDLFLAFQQQYPEVAEAMNVMGVSLQEYMLAMSALEDTPSGTGNARCQF